MPDAVVPIANVVRQRLRTAVRQIGRIRVRHLRARTVRQIWHTNGSKELQKRNRQHKRSDAAQVCTFFS
jgi:hypothetical protein